MPDRTSEESVGKSERPLDGAAEAPRAPTDTERVLMLQRSAGNVAVTRYLQRRAASDAVVARQPAKHGARGATARRAGGAIGAVGKALAKRRPPRSDGGSLSARIDTAYHYYRRQGLTRAQSAGLVGNLQQESGGRLNPSQRQFGGGPGRGIGQWTVGDSRYKELVAFAKQRNTAWDDYDTQIAFVWHELTKYAYFGLGALKKAKSVSAATRVVMEQYERPGEPHFDQRLGFAKAIHTRFSD